MSLYLRNTRMRLRRQKKRQIRRLRRLHIHPVVIPVAFFVTLVILTLGGFLFFNHGTPKFEPISSYIVIVSHDHTQETVPTRQKTIGDLLMKLHIKLHKGDRVEPSTDTQISQDNLRVNIYRAVPVQIVDGSHVTYGLSAATTSRSIASQAGVTVYPEDKVNTELPGNFVTNHSLGKRVVITRATPVNLNIFGTPTVIRTFAGTVGDLLAQKGVILGAGDSIKPKASTPLKPNIQVYLIHKGTKLVTEKQIIPAPTQVVRDNSLSFGTSAVRQEGSPGQEVITYQVITKNGKVVGKRQIQKVVTVQPVPRIIAQGQAVSIPSDKQAVMAQAGIPSSDYPYVNYIVSHESGWCPTKLQGQIGYCPGYAPSYFPSYLGYGLVQATPGTKMSTAGGDWRTNPVTQLRWATGYADSRYGSWSAAYYHWYAYHNW